MSYDVDKTTKKICTGRNKMSESVRYARFLETDREKRTREADKEGGEMIKVRRGGREKGKLPVLR